MEHLNPDQIVLLALGEQDEAADSAETSGSAGGAQHHLQICEICRRELDQFTRTVELAREGGDLGLQNPVVLPASIWSGIAEELGIGVAPVQPTPARTGRQPAIPGQREQPIGQPRTPTDIRRIDEPVARPRSQERRMSWRRGLLVAAAVLVVGAGVVSGVLIGRPAATSALVQSEAALAPMPKGPATAHGTATVTQTTAGLTLNVSAKQLPLRQGYYEVWLYDPTADQMVSVGTLGAGGDGAWTLASTIDLRSYSVVDVSAQDFDGNPAHKDSVLRGTLTQ